MRFNVSHVEVTDRSIMSGRDALRSMLMAFPECPELRIVRSAFERAQRS
jgi:hypothetical protein